MGTPRVEDLWEKEAYGESGERLGRIEAVGMSRSRVPRRVGVRGPGGKRALRFYALTDVSISGDRVVLAADRSLRVLRGITLGPEGVRKAERG